MLIRAATQLRALHAQAVSEGRDEDAADYERMLEHLLTRVHPPQTDLPMWKKVAVSASLSAAFVLVLRYLIDN